MESRITGSVKELGELLQSVKGSGPAATTSGQPPPRGPQPEADEVLRPLMDILVNISSKWILDKKYFEQ